MRVHFQMALNKRKIYKWKSKMEWHKEQIIKIEFPKNDGERDRKTHSHLDKYIYKNSPENRFHVVECQ